MPFLIRPFRRFPMQCAVTYNALVPSRAVETLWTENGAGTVARRGRRVYAATRSGPKTEIPGNIAWNTFP